MAALQLRNGTWRILFQHNGKQWALTIGKVSRAEARQWKGKVEHLLMRVTQKLLEIPRGCGIIDFIRHDGNPPVDPEVARHKESTLHQLREAYIQTVSNGALEKNTLYTAGIHLDHIEETLGKSFVLSGLTLGKLQQHISRRRQAVAPTTIKKEIDTFRAAWNWGLRMKWVDIPFPSGGLVYPKTDEKLPFMTWEEIQRRIAAGGDADALNEALFLQPSEISELITVAKTKKAQPWVYPAVVMAAHTGARKSEIMRVRLEDIDLADGVLTIREKKRAKGIRTTRRVPISTLLADALKPLMERQKGKVYLFGDGDRPLSPQAMQKALTRALKGSAWAAVTWHTLRHSFCSASASKGIDQRLIDDFLGHQTEQQRRRYRHLLPNVTKAAVASVFG